MPPKKISATSLFQDVAPPEQLSIRYMKIADLLPYRRNSRTHTASQIKLIEASLGKYGWTNPILIAGQGVLAGHARLAAATNMRDSGRSIARHADGSMVPTIDLSALSAPERRAYIIADNKLAEGSGWDNALLRLELSELKGDGFDLSFTGFSSPQLTTLLGITGAREEQKLPSGMQYQIIIECEGESHQARLLSDLAAQGLKARPLIL